MGIIWGEVASGALAKVGQEVRLDQQRARERRQNIIDERANIMFQQGTTLFNARRDERNKLKDKISTLSGMNFNRQDIRMLASLPEKKLDQVLLSIEEGQKKAKLETKPFDAASYISMPVDETARGITKTDPMSYSDWEDSLLNDIMGTVNPNKFKSSKEEQNFSNSFRNSLRNQFGWAGGESEEALQTAALLSGKSPAELQAVLDDDYERADIDPPQYTIPYSQTEELNIQNLQLTYETNQLNLEALRAEKIADNQTIGQLRKRFNNPNYGVLRGELAPANMTVKEYRKNLGYHQTEIEMAVKERKLADVGKPTLAEQNNTAKYAVEVTNELLGKQTKYDMVGGVLMKGKDIDPLAANLLQTVSTNALNVVNNSRNLTNDVANTKAVIQAIVPDLVLFETFSILRDRIPASNAAERDKQIKKLLSSDKPFSNIKSIYSDNIIGENFASLVSDNAVLKERIVKNGDALLEFYKENDYNKAIGLQILQDGYIEQIAKKPEGRVLDRTKLTKFVIEPTFTADPIVGGKLNVLDNTINEIFAKRPSESVTGFFSTEIRQSIMNKGAEFGIADFLQLVDTKLINGITARTITRDNFVSQLNDIVNKGKVISNTEDEPTAALPEEDQKRISNLAIIADEIVGESLYNEANLQGNAELRSLRNNIKKIMEKGKKEGHTLEDENELKNAVDAFMGFINKNKLLKDTKEYTKINDSVLKNIQKRHENYMKSIGR